MLGDMLLRINEEDVSRSPEIAFPTLKECVQSKEPFEVTFLRKCFDKLVVIVTRGGTVEANGKYQFWALDEHDAPVFVQEHTQSWALVRLDYDDQTGESIWALQKDGKDVYVGLSKDYSPPNGGWEEVNDGKKPAPGLSYFVKDSQVVKKWIADEQTEELKKHNMLIQGRKRKKKGNMGADLPALAENESANESGDSDDDGDVTTGGGQRPRTNTLSAIIAAAVSPAGSPRSSPQRTPQNGRAGTLPGMALGGGAGRYRAGAAVGPQQQGLTLAMLDKMSGNNSENGSGEFQQPYIGDRSASVFSAAGSMAEEVEAEIREFRKQISTLQDQLKQEKKRKNTIVQDYGSRMHEMEAKIQNEEKELQTAVEENGQLKKRLDFMREQLSDSNYFYWDLWMLQWDQHLEVENLKHDMRQTKQKWNLAKKQLFQAQRKIDDLEDTLATQKQSMEKEIIDLKAKTNENIKTDEIITQSSFTSMLESENKSADKDFAFLEMQTELIDLKTKLTKKDFEIEELKLDSQKWQDAHDSIFEQMSQAHKRLSEETAEFESAKLFYRKKLDRMRDIVQDNEIEMFEFEKRIHDLEGQFKEKTGEEPTTWQPPKRRKSVRYSHSSRKSKLLGSNKHAPRDSNASLGSDFGEAGMIFSTYDNDKNISFRRQSERTGQLLEDLQAFNDSNNYEDDDLFEEEDATGAFGPFGAFAASSEPVSPLTEANENENQTPTTDIETTTDKIGKQASLRFIQSAGSDDTEDDDEPPVPDDAKSPKKIYKINITGS